MAKAAAPFIDLRSDTVTKPTDEMRTAMAKADVGDDVYGEDPTVRELERVAAERMHKDAAVYMPSGTMVNQTAVWVHTRRGGSMVCEAGAHVHYYEGGGPALLSNVTVRTIEGRRGVFTPDQVEAFLPPDPIHYSELRLIEIENTHTRAGGTCWTPTQTKAITQFARGHEIPVHLDGARIFNSAVAQGLPVHRLTEGVDSVGFCLSKGLSAPVGSLLCGTREFVEKARTVRKTLGGGMRQAGIIAAAGLVALDTMVERLREDHANAKRLADGLAKFPGIRIELDTVQTNIVNFDIAETGFAAPEFLSALDARGVKCCERDVGPVVRMVTNRHITRESVNETLRIVDAVLETRPARRPNGAPKRIRHSSQTR